MTIVILPSRRTLTYPAWLSPAPNVSGSEINAERMALTHTTTVELSGLANALILLNYFEIALSVARNSETSR
jgi:hypothetical protein